MKVIVFGVIGIVGCFFVESLLKVGYLVIVFVWLF